MSDDHSDEDEGEEGSDWFEDAMREMDEEFEESIESVTEESPEGTEEGSAEETNQEEDEAAAEAAPSAGEEEASNGEEEGSVGFPDVGEASPGSEERTGGEQPGGEALEESDGPDMGAGGEDFGFGGLGGEADGEEDFGFGGGDEEFGFGGGGGGGGTEFDEEEFESDIERVDVGIEGLDEMVLGGVPRRSLMVAIGSAGTGKTTFGLQFLHEALRNGDKGIYITLEESRDAIVSTAEEKGWPFEEYMEEDQLAVVALDPIEMANSLTSIRSDISRLVDDFGADRLVLDSVSLLEMMYDTPSERRSEVFDFGRSLKEAGVTTMLTSEASEESAYTSRYGIVEYLADAVFILQYVRPSDFRETRLAVEIQKIRDANHSRETKPYEITDEGISVYRQANIF